MNHTDEGEFVGNICKPCHTMLSTGLVTSGNTFIHMIVQDLVEWKDEARKLLTRNR